MQETNSLQDIILEPPLYFSSDNAQIWNVDFHPSSNLLAYSQINGSVTILSYNSDSVNPLLKNTKMHKSSVRHCCFSPSGKILASCGSDRRIGFLDVNGQELHVIRKAHPAPVYRCKFLNSSTLISGDDDGLLRIWDLRTGTAIYEAHWQSEAITGITFQEEESGYNHIYTSCLDGTIAVYDLRQGSDSMSKLRCMSDSIDEQLSAIEIMNNGKYLVCPTSEGFLAFYDKNQLSCLLEKVPYTQGSIDALIKLDEDTVLTGSQDGYVRGIGTYPHKNIQVLGQHEEDIEESFPIQSLSISHCGRFLASSSHDSSIKFYDIHQFVKKRKNKVFLMEEDEQFEKEIEEIAEKWESEEECDSSSSQEEVVIVEKKRRQRGRKTYKKQMNKQKVTWLFKY